MQAHSFVKGFHTHLLLVTLEWTTPPITGTPPKTRQGHISAVVGDKLFVHGGVFGQDVLNDVHVLILGIIMCGFV